MSKIKDFSIAIPESKLEDLKKRLELTRWPEKETPEDWTQGIPLSYMKEIHEYWLNDYDWKKHEKNINEFPQYITNINDLDIHFIHCPSPHKEAKQSMVEILKMLFMW